jgi:CheY-like chemotaxis protein
MSNKSIEILLVEDNSGDAYLLREMFKRQTSELVELTPVECVSDAEKHLAEHHFDIVLLDLGLPDAHGLGAVRRCGGAARLRPTSHWWCLRTWTTNR